MWLSGDGDFDRRLYSSSGAEVREGARPVVLALPVIANEGIVKFGDALTAGAARRDRGAYQSSSLECRVLM